ncbi:MAG: PKD domain-containing protein [Halanaerobiales bacterium]|nr:PKD domain-containing protein [Halanaerobiales bacterium]
MRKKFLLLISLLTVIGLIGCGSPTKILNSLPTANFVFDPLEPEVNQDVSFNASGSNDAEDGLNLAARWDFNGDGEWEIDYSNGKRVIDSVTYTYQSESEFSVILEVRDSMNETDRYSKIISVRSNANTAPHATFTFSSNDVYIGETVTFDASSSNDAEDGQNLAARWDFNGDGVWEIDYAIGKKIGDQVTYIYDNPGNYTVILEVKDSFGAVDIVSHEIIIKDGAQVSIAGFVVDSRGGVGIQGATFTLSDETGKIFTSTSDGNGSFSFNVYPRIYQLNITKDGYATSKVQDLYLDKHSYDNLDIPLREEFYHDWSSESPTIKVFNLEETLSGLILFQIEGISDIGIKIIDIRVGHNGYQPDYSFTDTNYCEVEIDTNLLPNGANFIKINMYDVNYNYVETYIPIIIENSEENIELTRPEIFELVAFTFGQSLKLFSEEEIILSDNGIKNNKGLSKILEFAKDYDTTIATTLEWDWDFDAEGYKIYRSFFENGYYELIATTFGSFFVDTSAVLEPGQEVYYRVSAYNKGIESELSDPVYTIPLEPFNVSLISPAKEAIITTPTPTFEWRNSQLVGENQSYYLIAQGVTDGFRSMEGWVDDSILVDYNGIPLEDDKEYEWDIVYAEAFTIYSQYSFAVSTSGQDIGSINGWFRFRTNFE